MIKGWNEEVQLGWDNFGDVRKLDNLPQVIKSQWMIISTSKSYVK